MALLLPFGQLSHLQNGFVAMSGLSDEFQSGKHACLGIESCALVQSNQCNKNAAACTQLYLSAMRPKRGGMDISSSLLQQEAQAPALAGS